MLLAYDENGIPLETFRIRYVLATLYFSTQGNYTTEDSFVSSSWDDRSHWLSGFPVCMWHGVTCLDENGGWDSIGIVSGLNLSSNGLEGELPDELGLLQNDIRSLDLSGNSIGGSIPQSLASLRNLSKLRFCICRCNKHLKSGLTQIALSVTT